MASRQFASLTPKCSSMISERRKPGVKAMAATFFLRSSRAMVNACRITVVLIMSKKRSEEHTSELQSRFDLVCRLLLEKKKNKRNKNRHMKNQHKQHTTY